MWLRTLVLLVSAVALASPAQPETLSERLSRPGSHVVVALDLPYTIVAALVTAALEPKYEGRLDDPTDLLKKDRLTWSAEPGPIDVTGVDGKVVVSASASGAVRIVGKALIFDVSETGTLSGNVTITMSPIFQKDWSTEPNAHATARLDVAEVNLSGNRLDLRRLLQPALDLAVDRAMAQAAERLRDPALLRRELTPLWQDACRQVEIEGVRFNVVPQDLAVRQPVPGSAAVRATAIISARTELATSDPPDCPPLPPTLDVLDD